MNAPVIRNVANATIQKMNTEGPAACTPAALLMNRTIATKITTRSNGPSVRATRTGATFSEIMAFWSARAAMRHPPVRGRARPNRVRARPHQPSSANPRIGQPACATPTFGRYSAETPAAERAPEVCPEATRALPWREQPSLDPSGAIQHLEYAVP